MCKGGVMWGSGPQTDKTPAAKSLYRSFFMTTFCIVLSFYATKKHMLALLGGGGGAQAVLHQDLKGN
jgi:hypothetical protein